MIFLEELLDISKNVGVMADCVQKNIILLLVYLLVLVCELLITVRILITLRFRFSISVRYKGKTIPLKNWTGPERSRSLRLPDFKTVDA